MIQNDVVQRHIYFWLDRKNKAFLESQFQIPIRKRNITWSEASLVMGLKNGRFSRHFLSQYLSHVKNWPRPEQVVRKSTTIAEMSFLAMDSFFKVSARCQKLMKNTKRDVSRVTQVFFSWFLTKGQTSYLHELRLYIDTYMYLEYACILICQIHYDVLTISCITLYN